MLFGRNRCQCAASQGMFLFNGFSVCRIMLVCVGFFYKKEATYAFLFIYCVFNAEVDGDLIATFDYCFVCLLDWV